MKKDNQRVYIEKIYNTNDEVIELNIQMKNQY